MVNNENDTNSMQKGTNQEPITKKEIPNEMRNISNKMNPSLTGKYGIVIAHTHSKRRDRRQSQTRDKYPAKMPELADWKR